jgi:very-short-patch-repair endonuclease
MGAQSAGDLEIAALAGAQYGVVAHAQLVERGLTRREIGGRVAAGRLQRLYRGVYAVGHRVLRVEGHWMAAVLACGEGAVLSHQTAPAVWELRRVGSGVIHVTVPGDPGRKQREGIRVHRSVTLTERDVTRVRGLPVTTVARTIIDLSRTLSRDELEELVHRADDRGLVDFRDLRAARSASLQAVLRTYDPAPTRSKLERDFLKLCRDHGIQRPEVNAYIEGYLVDFLWRDRKLIVEVDGYEHHRTRRKFESDRERDVVLSTRGWGVRRFTWRQLAEKPGWVAAMTKKA